MLGCSFQVLGKNDGRLMLVCQSTWVSNVSSNRTRRTAPVLSWSGTSVRPCVRTSLTEIEFAQFQRPIRSGVLSVMVVLRLSLNRCSVSTGSVSRPGISNVPLATWNCWRFWYEKLGDQVIQGVMLMAAGVRLTVGNVCDTLLFERSWERLPPILRVPQENCFAKFKFDATVDVTSQGLRELRCMS